jgi:radical SAM protein with 4Fe4S-binding SPASM domain
MINGIEVDIEANEANSLYFDDIQTGDLHAYDVESIKEFLFSRTHRYAPYSVMWELTNRCNLGCRFCYINCSGIQKAAFPTLDECKAVIDGLVDSGMLFCTLTGGECLLHPEFSSIYTYLKQKGVLVSIFTNATLLNQSHFALFAEYPPYKIEVSIYGMTEEHFKFATKAAGGLYKIVLDNILTLCSMGIQVVCKTPLNALTEKDLPKIKLWCKSHNVPFYSSPELLDTYSGESVAKFRASEMLLEEYEMRKYQELAKNTQNTYGYRKAFECPAGKFIAFISYDMDIYPCSAAFGTNKFAVSIRQKGIVDAINTLRGIIHFYRGKTLSKCTGCNYFDVCSYCIIDEYKEINDFCEQFHASVCMWRGRKNQMI